MCSRLLEMWKIAEKDLGLEVVSPFNLKLPSGVSIKIEILVKNYGASRGMLIVNDYNKLSDYIDEIIKCGYGFSVMSEPREDEKYSKEDFIELLNDWGKVKES